MRSTAAAGTGPFRDATSRTAEEATGDFLGSWGNGRDGADFQGGHHV